MESMNTPALNHFYRLYYECVNKCVLHNVAASGTSSPLLFMNTTNNRIHSTWSKNLLFFIKIAAEMERGCCSAEGRVWHCVECNQLHPLMLPEPLINLHLAHEAVCCLQRWLTDWQREVEMWARARGEDKWALPHTHSIQINLHVEERRSCPSCENTSLLINTSQEKFVSVNSSKRTSSPKTERSSSSAHLHSKTVLQHSLKQQQ